MRTYLLSALTVASFALVALGPANAENAPVGMHEPGFCLRRRSRCQELPLV